ncbi:tetratricopeptide repeat protein [Bradyrhizobium sp. STM 3557]|uniref:tetratricopeptide repeat protein n=1 Tax=Bradyrhizobium sp. STM 3557 TaxID=578920 RepID=UPI00388E5533
MTDTDKKRECSIEEAAAGVSRFRSLWAGSKSVHRPLLAALSDHSRRIGAGLAGLAAVGTIVGGLTGYWSAYKVVVSDWIGRKQVTMEVPRLSIAVLPFDNLTEDPALGFFGDAVVDNLTTDLSTRMPEAVIIASAASLEYKQRPLEPRKVGKQLNVQYLLTGSVLRTGSSVRINARLLDSKDGQELWADSFEGNMAELPNIQDQVTSRISNSLQFTLPAVCIRRTEKPDNEDAFENLLRGKVALNDERRRGINPRKEAERYFRKAMLLQPENSEIQTELALVIAENLFLSRLLPTEQQPASDEVRAKRREASELIEKATRLLPGTPNARLARALLSLHDHDFESARLQLEQARSTNPSDYMILYFLSLDYEYLGRPADALPVFQEIYLRTAGRVPAYHVILLAWGRVQLLLGKWHDALETLKEAHALRPSPATTEALAIAYAENGDLKMARSLFASWREWHIKHFGVPTIKSLLASHRQLSNVPEYINLVNATYLDAYRKLGVAEQ